MWRRRRRPLRRAQRGSERGGGAVPVATQGHGRESHARDPSARVGPDSIRSILSRARARGGVWRRRWRLALAGRRGADGDKCRRTGEFPAATQGHGSESHALDPPAGVTPDSIRSILSRARAGGGVWRRRRRLALAARRAQRGYKGGNGGGHERSPKWKWTTILDELSRPGMGQYKFKAVGGRWWCVKLFQKVGPLC